MKKSFLFCILALSLSNFSFSQDKGVSFMTYGGVGLFLPSSGMKENSMIGNGVNFSFGHFQSIGNPTRGLQWGVEARLNYSKFEKDLRPSTFAASIPYNDGISPTNILPLSLTTELKKPDAFHFLIGPSALFVCNKLILQPSILAGYGSVSQEQFHYWSYIYNATTPSDDSTLTLYSGGHETNNEFVIVPGVKAGYRFHKNIAAMISFEYSIGSRQKFVDMEYKPAGPAGQAYTYHEMVTGVETDYPRESRLRAMIINFNVAFTLPRK